MHFSLTHEEFERLLKLATIGESVMNDWTPTEQLTQEQLAASEMLYDLCARAADSPLAGLTSLDEPSGEYVPSQALKQELDHWLGTYDNDVFWDELVVRMAQRDALSEYGKEGLEQMPEAYREQAEKSLRDYYWREVREHGIERLAFREEPAKRERRRTRGKGESAKRRQSEDASS